MTESLSETAIVEERKLSVIGDSDTTENGRSPPASVPPESAVINESDEDNVSSYKISKSKPLCPTSRKTGRNIKNVSKRRISLTSISEKVTTGSGSSNRRSSLEMRRMPVDILLKPSHIHETASVLSEDIEEENPSKEGAHPEIKSDFLRCMCLRPSYTLRKQMMLSFGIINLITLVVVVLVCVTLTLIAGHNVKSASSETMEQLAYQSLGYRSRYLAESLTESIILFDTVKLLYEATRDRFEGHPDPTDANVPFFDLLSGSNVYPITGPALSLEWDVSPNVNEENHGEFLQSRWKIFNNHSVDTRGAGFVMQGACDPQETDPLADAYWPNCTSANNDIRTGGVISPSNTTELYHRKGGDLVPIFRGIFEEWEAIRDIGLYFLNNGSGAGVNYPQYSLSTQSSYTSIGCDWLLSPNPYDPSRSIGTEEMVKNCRPAGVKVSSRLYNPMERGWCRDEALNPGRFFAEAVENAWNPGEWLLGLGKSVYDRKTNEFVACMYIGINLDRINELLLVSKPSTTAEATVIHYEEQGYVVASSKNLMLGKRLTVEDAGIGLDQDTYDELFSLVDFESKWDPDEARQTFEDFSTNDETFFVSAYPMPPIPDTYDPDYRPIFLVLTSSPVEVVYASVIALNDNIDERVENVVGFAWICGLIGFAIATVTIFAMAHILTSPLTNMNKVANEIVGSFGDSRKEDEIRKTGDVSLESKCSPRTELSDVVVEFNVMVTNFSGATEAKSEKFKDADMDNTYPSRGELCDLYKSRKNELFKYNVTGEHVDDKRTAKGDDSSAGSISLNSISYLHYGSNYIRTLNPWTIEANGFDESSDPSLRGKKCSSLFLWIVALIVTPLLFITILLSVGVITTINIEYARSTQEIQSEYLSVQKQVMLSYARLRSAFVSSYTEKYTNDLNLYTRYSSWLIFGGLNRSDQVFEMTTGVEECKNYSDDFSECAYVAENFVCDCAWNEKGYGDTCNVFSDASSSRRLQAMHWITEVSDAADGGRHTTSFPHAFTSPDTGTWWDDLRTVPGSERNDTSPMYSTTYDRVRNIAAVPIVYPLYNYGLGDGKEATIGIGMGFEEDGTFASYEGCFSSRHVTLSSWFSTVENGAAAMRPELCPLGKYGYDPRCRGWYNTGRNRFFEESRLLHVTAPYEFAQDTLHGSVYAQTASMTVFDPNTSQIVGQTFLDYRSEPIYRALENNTYLGEGGFPILITVGDGTGPETIIGPGISEGQGAVNISAAVLSFDQDCKEIEECKIRLRNFDEVVARMKKGESDEVVLERKTESGQTEIFHMAFSPVYSTISEPIDSSDFSRGVKRTSQLVYSIALVETEKGMLLPFRNIETTTKKQTNVAISILTFVIFVATLSIMYVSHRLAESFSKPMLYLLCLLQSINKNGVGSDTPPMRTIKASHEIVAFSTTLEALFRIVRSANMAFFNGEHEFAYCVLNDALRLFKRLDNKKAIGIAANNIGNILLGIYREMTAARVTKLHGITKEDVVARGIAHFHNAIQLGEKAYDEFYELQGWSPSCLDFMQHLANRYFNRGLFLLHIRKDHENPKEIEQLGMRDIQIACDMDHEVVAYGEDVGWGSTDRAEKRFNVNIMRIRGFNILHELGYTHDWGVEDVIDETIEIIKTEYKNPTSEFFETMSLAGRLQELEVQLMRHHANHGDIDTAARIGVRMLIEDERIFTEAMRQVIDVLIEYSESDKPDLEHPKTMAPVLRSYRRAVMERISDDRQAAKEDLDSMSSSLTKSLNNSGIALREGEERVTSPSGDDSSRFLTMEDF